MTPKMRPHKPMLAEWTSKILSLFHLMGLCQALNRLGNLSNSSSVQMNLTSCMLEHALYMCVCILGGCRAVGAEYVSKQVQTPLSQLSVDV